MKRENRKNYPESSTTSMTSDQYRPQPTAKSSGKWNLTGSREQVEGPFGEAKFNALLLPTGKVKPDNGEGIGLKSHNESRGRIPI